MRIFVLFLITLGLNYYFKDSGDNVKFLILGYGIFILIAWICDDICHCRKELEYLSYTLNLKEEEPHGPTELDQQRKS